MDGRTKGLRGMDGQRIDAIFTNVKRTKHLRVDRCRSCQRQSTKWPTVDVRQIVTIRKTMKAHFTRIPRTQSWRDTYRSLANIATKKKLRRPFDWRRSMLLGMACVSTTLAPEVVICVHSRRFLLDIQGVRYGFKLRSSFGRLHRQNPDDQRYRTTRPVRSCIREPQCLGEGHVNAFVLPFGTAVSRRRSVEIFAVPGKDGYSIK